MHRPQRARRVVSILSLSVALALAACSGSSTSDPAAECTTPADCPGTDTECRVRSCWNGTCGFDAAAAGTPLADQVAGDCQQVQCDGAGGTTSVADDADLPTDANACTSEACVQGVPSSSFVAAGTACAQSGGVQCDGAGACVTCLDASECSIPPSPCVIATCTAGACGSSNAPDGTLVVADVPGDCKAATTCSAGSAVQLSDDSDVPADDGNACTADVCSSGVASHPPEPAGTACNQNGGTKCDGAGACVECVAGADCTSGVCASGACQAATCTDRVKNAAETDVDCGGGTCMKCFSPGACLSGSDCFSGKCVSGVCQAPAVVATSPADGAGAVAVSASISATFDVAMHLATLSGQGIDGPCDGSFQLSRDAFATCVAISAVVTPSAGDTVATWTPAAPLAYATTYAARIAGAAQSADGEPLGSAFTWSFTTEAAPVPAGAVVISQVYGGGGTTTGATYQYDYVELHNRSAAPVSLDGASVQYASAAGTTWQVTPLTGVIPAGGYYLVQEGLPGPSGAPLPVPPNVSGSIQLSTTAGKVALVSGTTALSGCPAAGAVLDLVGYGSTATCAEANPAATLTNTQAAYRNGSGCQDTGDNAADFVVAAPNPRNSASVRLVCGGAVNGTGLSQEADWCNVQYPASFEAAAGAATPIVYGRLYEAGVTEAAGASASVVAQLGFGGWGTNPVLDATGWTFVDAAYNTQVGNDDEYMASFTAPAPGTWGYAYRFSVDGGATWTYCDLDGAGSGAGLTFDVPQLGQLTVTP